MTTADLNFADRNKAIALFMNIPFYDAHSYTNFIYADNNHRTHIDLGYHESLAWLKPVLTKCVKFCKTHNLTEKLKALYKARRTKEVLTIYNEVINLINWKVLNTPEFKVISSYDDPLHDPEKNQSEYWVLFVNWGEEMGTQDLADFDTLEEANQHKINVEKIFEQSSNQGVEDYINKLN